MQLRYNPFQVFRASKTPAGLYARQKWLNESEKRKWRQDYTETVATLQAYAFPEIQNYAVALDTIRYLFGLHLTVRSSTAEIDDALVRLFSKISIESDRIAVNIAEGDQTADFRVLPFTNSQPETWYICASLFLASIFGRDRDPQLLRVYEWICKNGIGNEGLWLDTESTHNAFRALVVHPQYRNTKTARLVVDFIAGFQTDDGDWGPRLPFYQTLNALAHLELPGVSSQLGRAFHYIWKIQNSDGSWGQDEVEWNTFLTVHALKNKGLL